MVLSLSNHSGSIRMLTSNSTGSVTPSAMTTSGPGVASVDMLNAADHPSPGSSSTTFRPPSRNHTLSAWPFSSAVKVVWTSGMSGPAM